MPNYLPNKPLAEVILEVKWGMPDRPDPNYPRSLGLLYSQVSGQYPDQSDLPCSQLPPDVAVHMVRHQLRRGNEWPLVQLGPGVFTFNQAKSYTWTTFRDEAVRLHPLVCKATNAGESAPLHRLTLRYLDAWLVDDIGCGLDAFIKNRLHVTVGVPNEVFSDSMSTDLCGGNILLEYGCSDPEGVLSIQIAQGEQAKKPAYVLQTLFTSSDEAAQAGWLDFGNWMEKAHGVTKQCFFAMISGDLLEVATRDNQL